MSVILNLEAAEAKLGSTFYEQQSNVEALVAELELQAQAAVAEALLVRGNGVVVPGPVLAGVQTRLKEATTPTMWLCDYKDGENYWYADRDYALDHIEPGQVYTVERAVQLETVFVILRHNEATDSDELLEFSTEDLARAALEGKA